MSAPVPQPDAPLPNAGGTTVFPQASVPVTPTSAAEQNYVAPKTTVYTNNTNTDPESGSQTTVLTPVTPAAVTPPAPLTSLTSANTAPTPAPAPVPAPSPTTPAANTLGAALASFSSSLNGAGAPPPGWDAQTYANFKAANPGLEPTAQDTAQMLASGSPTSTNPIQSALANLLKLNSTIGTEGTETNNINNEEGIPDKTQAATTATNNYNAREQYYNDQIQKLQTTNPNGLDATGIQEQVDNLTRQKNTELADLAIQKTAADGDLTTAQSLATAKINAEFEPVQAQIDNLKAYIPLAQDDMTESEKTQATSALAVQQNQLDEQKQQQQDAYNYYIQYGVWPTGTPGAPNGAPTGYNGTSSSPSGTVVGGIDFGNVPGVGAYATDIDSEVSGVSANYNAITGSDAASIQTYITNNAPNSPVTGQMIVDAANAAGIDPKVLAAVLANESSFGTAGAGAKTMNPGNVGNTDNGSTTNMGSWQAGVQAAAQQLARRQASSTDLPLASANISPAAAALGATSADFKNGVPITAQGALASSNPSDSSAYAMATGAAAPSQYVSGRTATTAAGRMLLQRTNAISMALYNKPFSAADAEAAFKFRNSTQYQRLTANAPTAIQTIVQAAQAAQSLKLTNLGSFNQLKINALAGGYYPGGTPQLQAAAQTLKSFLALNQDDLGLILGTGSGSDNKTQLAGLIFDATGAPLSTQALSSSMVNKITDKLGQYYTAAGIKDGSTYATQTAQQLVNSALAGTDNTVNTSGTSAPAGTTQLTGPDGKLYNVPNANVAAFKAAGGH